MLYGQRLAEKSAGKTVRFNWTLGDWMKICCLQVWNLFQKHVLYCFLKTMGYFMQWLSVCIFYFVIWICWKFMSFQLEAVNVHEKGGNDVWVHFMKNMVGHAHYTDVILCVWHTILTQEKYPEQNKCSILRYSLGSFVTVTII